jgi:hypothetical protein
MALVSWRNWFNCIKGRLPTFRERILHSKKQKRMAASGHRPYNQTDLIDNNLG